MTKTTKPTETTNQKTLAASMIRRATYQRFDLWVVGNTPLITHAWSEKAKREMLAKQVKSVSAGKEARDPEADFLSSLYEMGEPGSYGFPATALKKAILGVAHKDKGIARSGALGAAAALWIDPVIVRTRPALAGAICDMPLLRIYGSDPEMREDMVRVGAGVRKTADFAYRAQFLIWAFRLTGRLNVDILTTESLGYLIEEAGLAIGIGDWRNEKSGYFGAFHLATDDEQRAWDAFAAGNGPLPSPTFEMQAAAE
jgi:hypothetical protein